MYLELYGFPLTLTDTLFRPSFGLLQYNTVIRVIFLKFIASWLFTCLKPSVFLSHLVKHESPFIIETLAHLHPCLLTFPLLSYSANSNYV